MQAGRHALAGTTILQLVPALRDDPAGQAAMDIAHTLLRSGARAIVAGDDGPLVDELRSIGAEWLPMPNNTANPLRIRSVASKLSHLISSERIDIVHAQSAGAAWSALIATHRQPVFLVTSFPDRLPPQWWPAKLFAGALARGNRVIAPSSYVSQAMIKRYNIPVNRISVVPRAIDTDSVRSGDGERKSNRRGAACLGHSSAHAHRVGARPDRPGQRSVELDRRRQAHHRCQRQQYRVCVRRRRQRTSAPCERPQTPS